MGNLLECFKISYKSEYFALKCLTRSDEVLGFRLGSNVGTELNLGPWMFPRITSGGTTENQDYSFFELFR